MPIRPRFPLARPLFPLGRWGWRWLPVCLLGLFPQIALAADAMTGTDFIPTSGSIDHRLAEFDELLLRFVRERNIPGGALAIAKDGRLVFARGYGYASLESRIPVEPESRFRIASISKPITAIAVLQLVEQNRL
ncbi:MAG TPA: serine hydrolase domain-containing protein, partial [Planctomycetaceae bacterium]|nr:serine hydrolase domain-containing protein [Planctomycetaceae bacterium]